MGFFSISKSITNNDFMTSWVGIGGKSTSFDSKVKILITHAIAPSIRKLEKIVWMPKDTRTWYNSRKKTFSNGIEKLVSMLLGSDIINPFPSVSHSEEVDSSLNS